MISAFTTHACPSRVALRDHLGHAHVNDCLVFCSSAGTPHPNVNSWLLKHRSLITDCSSLRMSRATPGETHGLARKGLLECAKVACWLLEVIIESSAPAPSASDRYPRVASAMHMILVLAVLGGWTLGHKISADLLSAGG